MNTTYKVQISQRAFTSLIECISFVKRVSPESADSLYPKRNPEVECLNIQNNPTRKMIINKGRYIILYRIDGNQVAIYDVLDDRKDNKVIGALL